MTDGRFGWRCGHPQTPENTQHIGKAGDRCKQCRRRIARESYRRHVVSKDRLAAPGPDLVRGPLEPKPDLDATTSASQMTAHELAEGLRGAAEDFRDGGSPYHAAAVEEAVARLAVCEHLLSCMDGLLILFGDQIPDTPRKGFESIKADFRTMKAKRGRGT